MTGAEIVQILATAGGALARSAPDMVKAIEDGIRGGKTFEEALADARATDPGAIDTSAEDLERRRKALATASDGDPATRPTEPPTPIPANPYGPYWLIERNDRGTIEWARTDSAGGLVGWVTDVHHATRYPTEAAARRASETPAIQLAAPGRLAVTEHEDVPPR